jgi:hypothetical protein
VGREGRREGGREGEERERERETRGGRCLFVASEKFCIFIALYKIKMWTTPHHTTTRHRSDSDTTLDSSL